MDGDGAENGMKLQRGRISLDRKREILEQYDLLPEPCSDTEAAAIFGVTKTTLLKIVSERDEIKAVGVKKEQDDTNKGDSEFSSSPKLRRGRWSYEKQREILRLYSKLPKCSNGEAANRLGVREATLVKLLASRKTTNSGKRKRQIVQSSSSDGDDYAPSEPECPPGPCRGPFSAEQQTKFLGVYDKLPKTTSHQAAAAKLQISEAALAKLLSSRDASTLRSPQPGGSGIRNPSLTRGSSMALRKGRRVRIDYSEDEQSGSDYEQKDSDFANDDDAELEDEDFEVKNPRHKHRSKAEKMAILAKYDAMQPCLQSHAAKILGVTQSSLCSWLKQRNLSNPNSAKPKTRKSKTDETTEDLVYSGEEIDSYVMAPKGPNKQTQVVQFFEVGTEDSNKSKGSSSNDSNLRKPHLTLKEKFELYKKYDAMDSMTQKNAADTFNILKSTWQNLLANRYYFEEQFKARLRQDMGILDKYDAIENKKVAAQVLGMAKQKLDKVLERRDEVEKYYNELVAPNEDDESIAQSIDEKESTWKDSKELKALEMELLHWFKHANNEQTVNWKDLKNKAEVLAAKSGMNDFHPSDLWLKKWNKTNRVFWNQRGKLVAIYGFGENRSVSESMLMALKDYPPENVFNLVESGLYYRALPGCLPLTDDWVVVAFACNMSGTEKKKLLVVGKSEAPLCFRVMPLPSTYKFSKTACMNEGIVSEFLEDWDQALATEKRKIALVLDSSSSHPNIHLSQIRLFFVPTDCTVVQPLSDGIVAQAKCTYRKRMAESLHYLSDCSSENVTIVDAMFALAEAWDNVPKSLLVSKFLNTTFPQNDTARTELETEELEILNKLDDEIQLHSSVDGLLGFGDGELSDLDGGRVVHIEGTLNLSDEEEENFDMDSLLRDQDTTDYDAPGSLNASPDLGSKLKNFLSKTSTPNSSVKTYTKDSGLPTTSDVKDALSTIKRFLHDNGGTLEDLTDYTQLEIKVLSKIKNIEAEFKCK